MDANRWQRIKALLEAVCRLPAEERAAFLANECGSDDDLRLEVESLLAAGRKAGGFLGSLAGEETVDSKAGPPESENAPTPAAIGGYRILRKLGSGGMGVVYEAQQQSPNRRVALKVVRGGRFVDEHRVRLFRREAETLARLKHPNIAAIYESGRTDDGQHYFAMELVSGRTLDAYLKTRLQRITREELRFRLDLFRELADAVHYAHQRGVIHRDLKPSNIIITASDPPQPKILDFGLARITEEDLAAASLTSEVGLIKGTLQYMSPEQTRADPQEIDLRADVYSLGVILYEMLSGQQPYDVMKKALGEAVRVICEEAPRSLSRSWSGVRRLDADIETIVGKALQKEADRRYASAAAFSEDVGRYLDSQPILARPPSAAYHLRKFAQRNRALVAGAGATVLALIAGTVISTVFGLREAEQRREAARARDDLQAVVEFQESMLSDVDPSQMGQGLVDDLAERLTASREMQGDDAEEVERIRSTFEEWIDEVNATDAALGILDRDVLQRAAATIAEKFGDQPEVAARLEHKIAETYVRLGMLQQSEPHIRRAFEQREDLLGGEHEATLSSLSGLASVLGGQGRYDEAEPLMLRLMEAHRRGLTGDHPKMHDTQLNLASMYLMQGRYDEAESVVLETLDFLRHTLGDDHPDTLYALDAHVALLMRSNRFEQAESTLLEALEGRKRVLGDDHKDTLDSLDKLAALYLKQRSFDEAEPLLVEVLERRSRLFGDDHPDTLRCMHNLAALYSGQQRWDKAETLLRETIERRARVLGEDHPHTLGAVVNLVNDYLSQNRFDGAEPLLVRVLETTRRTQGNDHPDSLFYATNLAGLYGMQGRYEDAEPLYREVLEHLTRTKGDDHIETARIQGAMDEIIKAKSRPVFISTEQYETRSIEGWTVHVNKDLLADGSKLGAEAIGLLTTQLHEIARVVPEKASDELRRVPIWLGIDDGHAPCAEYHPNREWLRENGYNPDKAKSVEIGSASLFLSRSLHEPRMVLQLLAGAYRDLVLGADHEGIHGTFQAAVEGGYNTRILRFNGRLEPSVVVEDEWMYFTHGTAAFFGTDDERAELLHHDPKLYELLEEVW